jgi:hypothetical protein
LDYDFNSDTHRVFMSGCHLGDNQKWRLEGFLTNPSENSFLIKTIYNEKCVDYDVNKEDIYMHRCHNAENQKWKFDLKESVSHEFPYGPVTTRYVKLVVQSWHKHISMRAAAITCNSQESQWLDLKSHAIATQSSTAEGGVAFRAIDGNAHTNWGSNSCTHTKNEVNPWWQVDLGSTQAIKAVQVTNRGDCCGGALNGFSVRVGGTLCASGVSIGQGETKVVPCNGVGNIVRVEMAKKTPLMICEFKVLPSSV